MMKNNFYVYVHSRLSTGEPFYVGKGFSKRAYSLGSRNVYWKNIVKKSGGFYVSFIATDLDEDFAFLLECEMIDRYKRFGMKLSNQTEGGEGAKNLCEESRVLHRNNTKIAMNNDVIKNNCKLHALKLHNNPEWKEARLKELREYWANPENRKKQSDKIKQFFKDNPERFENDCKKRKLAQENPEVRLKMRLAKLGKKQSKETIEKRAAANRGKIRGKYKQRNSES